MQTEPGKEHIFTRSMLPWLIAAAALIVYLLTLNPWISIFQYYTTAPSFGNLSSIARISGWTWTPEVSNPAYYVVTLPARLLPASWSPLVMNVFSAVCAALVLYQLARCVVLLPHNRTHEQRLRVRGDDSLLPVPLAWVPPLLAVLVCGLQMTFWEHATNGTGEMFDLLLFSYVIRSLLEYRIDDRESRLLRAALVYGIGMTNNFAMVGFFPAFIVAIIWIRGLSFFNLKFLSRMALCGLCGISLYLLLPLLSTFSGDESLTFWQVLKVNLVSQKNILVLFPKKTALTLALTSLLPVFVMSIRWASYMRVGDTSRLGAVLASVMFHVFHAFFLFVCIWVFFDPPFSPRQKGLGVPFLTYYYLGALSIGYFSGYFLLVFRRRTGRARGSSPVFLKLNALATGVVVALLILAPLGLLVRNLPGIRTTNSQAVKLFAAAQTAELPQGGVLLSDDALRLMLTQAWLARNGRDKEFMFVDTQSLRWPSYHRHLHDAHPQLWELPPEDSRMKLIGSMVNISRIAKLATVSKIYYLHPSFGYYFEVFYLEPLGMVYDLKRFDAGTLLAPQLSPEIIEKNESFWSNTASQLLEALSASNASNAPDEKPSFLGQLFQKLHVPRERNRQNAQLAAYCSRSLDYWGVEEQKAGKLDKAAGLFRLATRINSDNVVAEINLEFNKNLEAGITTPVVASKSIEERLTNYRSLDQVLNANGPYDEPGFCYLQAWTFMRNRLYRQAAQNYDRVSKINPSDFKSRQALAQIHLVANQPDATLNLVHEIRSEPERFHLTSTNYNDLVALEASAFFLKNETNKAHDLLDAAVKERPEDLRLLANVVNVYTQRRDYTNALSTVDYCLKLHPDNTGILITKGYICILMEDFDTSLAALDRALAIEPNNAQALLNRGIAYLRLERFDEAKRDYQTLDQKFPGQQQVQFGLAEIAWRQKDTNAAIRYYRTFLTNAPPASPEAKLVIGRLKQLRGEKTE